MIGLIPRPGISRNYGDGISTVSMINGHLTLFVLACHWPSPLPVTEVFYFLYSASHTHGKILNASSITSTENLLIIADNFQSKVPSKSTMSWWVNSLFFFQEGCYLFIYLFTAVRNLVRLTLPLWLSTHIVWDWVTFLFFFLILLQIIKLGCSRNPEGERCLQVEISGGFFVHQWIQLLAPGDLIPEKESIVFPDCPCRLLK